MRLAFIAIVLSTCTFAFGDELTALKPMMLETPLLKGDRPNALIVAGPKYEELADKLAANLADVTGVNFKVFSDAQASINPGRPGHLIALGQFGNNKLLEKLYNRHYLVVDGAQPGAGGYLLQSIHNPDAMGRNVIVVGGSDDAGVQRAADRLVQIVREKGTTLPYLLDVELGWGREMVEQRIEEVIAPDRVWPDNHPMEIQQSIAEAGTLYLYTCDERVGQAYKRQLFHFIDKSPIVGVSDDFDFTMVVWDQIEESPLFDNAERLRITKRLWEIIQFYRTDEEINHVNWLKALDMPEPRWNHQARYAGSLYFSARYYLQYYDMPECRGWLDEVERYWRPQMRTFTIGEGMHHLGNVTLNKALEYALAEGVDTFISRDVLGSLAQRELARTIGSVWLPQPREFQPFLYWTVAAKRFDEPKYLRPLARQDIPMNFLRMPWRHTWTITGSHWDGTMPDLSESHVDQWITPIHIDHAFYDGMQPYGPKNVPLDDTFQSLVIQDPSLSGQQYMALEGISLGYTGVEGANAINFFYLAGQRWLWGGGDVGGRIATAPKYSTLQVIRDGAIQPTPAYAKLLGVHNEPGWGITRTALIDHNGLDWTRNIVNVPNQFFLVIDEVTAKLDDAFTLESRWDGHEHVAFDGDDVVFPNGDVRLRLTGTGWDNQYARPWLYSDYLLTEPDDYPRTEPFVPDGGPKYGVQLARRWSGTLKRGQSHQFANLFAVESADATTAACTLVTLDDHTMFVKSGDHAWRIAQDKQLGWRVDPADNLPSVTSSAPAPSDAPPSMEPEWSKRMEHRVLSATAVDQLYGKPLWAVGLSDGSVQVIDGSGKVTATWSVEGRVFAITAIDLDGDGTDEIVTGTEAGNVDANRLDGTPVAAWHAPPWKPGPAYRQMFGTWRNVITELHPFKLGDGQPALIVAGTFYYVLDASLNTVSSYEIDRELDVTDMPGNGFKQGMWLTGERTFIMTPVDFDGDGTQEVAGEEPGGRWLRVWDATSGVRKHTYDRPADRNRGTSIKSIAAGDLDGDGTEEAVVGLDAFNQQLLVHDHPYRSQPTWTKRVSGAVEAIVIAPLRPGKEQQIVIATETAQLQVYDARGKRLFVTDTVEPVGSIDALKVVSSTGEARIWLTTINGRVAVFDANGESVALGRIAGYGAHITPSADGTAVLVASADGEVQCYAAR